MGAGGCCFPPCVTAAGTAACTMFGNLIHMIHTSVELVIADGRRAPTRDPHESAVRCHACIQVNLLTLAQRAYDVVQDIMSLDNA